MLPKSLSFLVIFVFADICTVLSANVSGGCGKRNPDGVAPVKREGIHESQFGEFPWTIRVYKRKNENSDNVFVEFPCCGSLIHPKVVLTSVSCALEQPPVNKNLTVRAGDWLSDDEDKETIPHQERDVSEIVSHEEYSNGKGGTVDRANDVAILILEKEFDLTSTVGTICLPPQGLDAPRETCVASGFGSYPTTEWPEVMKKMELPIVDRASCQEKLRTKKENVNVGESFICAGGESGKDMCNGDAGAPLACLVPGKSDTYMQSGIVSWGMQCGQKDIPGVYSNVAFLRQWIDEQLSKRNIDMTPYAF